MTCRLHLAFLLFCLPTLASASDPTAEGLEFFEKRIRPLFVENCYQCHSAGKKIRGGFRLDTKEGVLKGGDNGAALIPGQTDKGHLLRAVQYKDVELRMPPKGKLTEQQIADLTAWIKMGAPMPTDAGAIVGPGKFDLEKRKQHWSFQPIKRPSLPSIINHNSSINNPIDLFVVSRLQAAGLTPAPEADRRALIRRLTFDLTGLPPTPEEMERARNDKQEDWYERLVDRLLASPAYGERWARHWLDLVRYAETAGHEFDFEMPHAYQYRDYVVRALNDDLPYDQFVLEHLAGDLMPKPRYHPSRGFNESIIGTGFFFLGESKHSPVDIRAEGAERSDNQIDVMAKTFLGLTISCARCHDHKFDPITTKDYYALAGYLRSSRYQLLDNRSPEPTRTIVRTMQEHLEKAQTSAIAISSERLRGALTKIKDDDWKVFVKSWPELATLGDEVKAKRVETVERLKKQKADAAKPRLFADFNAPDFAGWLPSGDAWTDRPNRAIDAMLDWTRPVPVHRLLGPGGAASGRHGIRLYGALRSPSFTIDSKFILYRVAGRGTKINLIIDGFQQIRAPIYGGLTFGVNHGDDYRWHTMDVSMWQGHRAYIECLDESEGYMMIDRVHFADSPAAPPETPNPLLASLLDDPTLDADKLGKKLRELLTEVVTQWREGKLDTLPDGAARAKLVNHLLASATLIKFSEQAEDELTKRQAVMEHLQERLRLEMTLSGPLPIMAMADGSGENERVFIRGNHKTLGDETPRRFLEAVAGQEQPAPKQGSGRLELARRISDSTNPLTARVIVNRLWHHHFGTGIVRTPDDFGYQGQAPTHPELLDYLASRFVEDGWSLKSMHRLMVTSATYRMSSRGDPKADETDPENKLWHKASVRRLEAEAIRDNILAVSGRLDRRVGGPGVMPNLTPHMQGRGRPGHSGPVDGEGRRSLYVNVRRNFLSPLFLAFDYPIPFTTIGRRSVSNVPAQALALMNNPFVKQQAERWAKRLLATPNLSPSERIAHLYETAFGRLPADDEVAAAMDFLKEQGAMDEVRSWTELCHVLMNVKEFIFVN